MNLVLKENDEHLWSRFKRIFLTYHNPLRLYICRYMKDSNTAQDLVQEVFASVWDNREAIDFTTPIKPLLYRYAYNKAVDYLKSDSFNKEIPDGDASCSLPAPYGAGLISYQPEEEYQFRELNREILACVKNLPDQCRKFIT